MTDLPDIDIEAERKDFEAAFETGYGLTRNTAEGIYLDENTEAACDGWLARARLAAKREREMQQEIAARDAEIKRLNRLINSRNIL